MCNQALIGWLKKKIKAIESDEKELRQEVEIARKNKWKSTTLIRHADLAAKRMSYYQKVQGALEEGYYIVPNFPIDMFAIRTDRKKPSENLYIGTHGAFDDHFQQQPHVLPAGAGEYKNPDPLVRTDTEKGTDKQGHPETTYTQFATKWQDEIEFPLAMAKLQIMKATSHAMKLKIFDELGILRDTAISEKCGDPMIVGRIIDPRPVGYSGIKCVSFIIGWHLRTELL